MEPIGKDQDAGEGVAGTEEGREDEREDEDDDEGEGDPGKHER